MLPNNNPTLTINWTAVLLLAIVMALALSACQSKRLASIYDPTYIEQLQTEAESDDLVLPPGLNLNTSDEFTVPDKITDKITEYEQIFGIFSENRSFSFQSDGQGSYWLRTRAKPEAIWVGLKEFFRIEGLEIDHENFAVGEMRTRWAENLARNQFPDAVFHHADRYLVQLLPASDPGWRNLHIRHQGVYRDLRDIPDKAEQGEGDGKKKKRRSRRSGKRDEVLAGYLRTRRAAWRMRPAESRLAVEMLTRIAVFLGSPKDRAEQLRREHITGVLGRIFLERSEFGDISLVVGDSQARTFVFIQNTLDSLKQFGSISSKEQPERLLFSIKDYANLDPSLPADLYIYFIRNGEYIKLLLFDQQDNIINPILAESFYRLIAKALRPKFVEIDLPELDLIDTKSLPSRQ